MRRPKNPLRPPEKAGSTYTIPVYQLQVICDKKITTPHRKANHPADVAEIVREYLQGVDKEHFVVLCLSASNGLIGIHTASIGTLNSTLIHPREVFKIACLLNAAQVIVAHNHPSGNPEPSAEDLQVTRQLTEAGKIMGIPVLDALIVTESDGYTSFSEKGIL